MTEQPSVPRQPAGDGEQPPPGSGEEPVPSANVRTQGETAVDEAIGTGDNLH